MIDYVLAEKIVAYLNELLELDRPAVSAMIANRVPCNEELSDHPTCQSGKQHGGFCVGLLGLLNGLCGVNKLGWGPIVAVFDNPENENFPKEFSDLVRFEVGKF